MNDIKQALAQALSKANGEWSEDAPATASKAPHRFRVSNNVTQATFDFIKHHPGTTSMDVTKALVQKGYKATSVSSLITQMVRAQCVERRSNNLFATKDRFTPLKRVKPAVAPKQEPRFIDVVTYRGEVSTPKTFDTDALLGTLSVLQARQLYDRLKAVFGGV